VLSAGLLFLAAGLYKKNYVIIGAAGLILGAISMRGAIVLGCALTAFVLRAIILKDRRLIEKRVIVLLLPGLLLAAYWQWFHWSQTGWGGYHAGSPWAGSFVHPAGVSEVIKQGIIFFWRLCDFGMWPLWIVFIYIIIVRFRELRRDPLRLLLYIWFFLTFFTFLFIAIYYKYVNAHRYQLPVLLLGALIIMSAWQEIRCNKVFKVIFFCFIICSMVTGHLWKYPRGVAMGWDSTLGHVPFYSLQRQCDQYLTKQQLLKSSIGSAYPQLGSVEEIYCAGGVDGFHAYDLEKDSIVYYSNVFNDFNDQDIRTLFTTWDKVKEWKSYPVECVLFQKKKN
jgi:hypothetical protein